ncbi:MAG TPA: DUF5658 family protein [Blastocatellia bacterium]|nr:DUF5658 family protein [Blastocatellia bacterium]
MTILRQAVPVIFAVIGINVMSLIDAISTELLVENDGFVELNPLMDVLIGNSYLPFFVVKLVITLAATLTCWHFYERRRAAGTVLKWTSRVYCALMVWHTVLLSIVMR